MKILVCVASRYGGTAEIGARIFSVLDLTLNESGYRAEVVLRSPEELTSVEEYDAVVLGSAVYMGRWLTTARAFVEAHAAQLSALPVWLFSSGPVGRPLKPEEEPVDAAAMVAATHARDHRVFAGRLDRHRLGFREKAVVVALRAPEGDFRDWTEIEAWAGSVAAELRVGAATPAG